MGSLGEYEGGVERKKAMWLFPKVVGFNPSERWGHTACFSQGHVYVFGGCCGGMHYSDVLVLNLDTMTWTTLVTTGKGPGPRDSHTATLWGKRIIVFGGTNGSKKVNDIHILDLESKVWVQPSCSGAYPSARESHTATLVGDDQLVVFGGSGEGVGNYLNDLHFLDLRTMCWTSPLVKGDVPPPRDSHISVAVGRKVFVHGGDCGDRYHGDVDVFDIDTLTWSRLDVRGPSPGRRAGHAAVRIGTKVYVVGGVGDKRYYNDTWLLDTTISSWTKLDICGPPPQGRFSHAAIDERPLGELLILHLGEEHPNGRYNISMCKSFGNHRNQRRRRNHSDTQLQKTMLLGSCIETEIKDTNDLDISLSKRRRIMKSKTWEKEPEQEEHSLSVSQSSSPSQSDQEQTNVQNQTSSLPLPQNFQFPSMNQLTKPPRQTQQNLPDVYILGEHRPNQRQGHPVHAVKTEVEFLTANQNFPQNLNGAEVHGKVDGSFDSGYLMTATVNGRILRGGPSILYKGANRTQNSNFGQIPAPQPCTNNSNRGSTYVKSSISPLIKSPIVGAKPDYGQGNVDRPSPIFRAHPTRDQDLRQRSDLQGVVLTLGGPGSSHS
ncbi:Rab9 effector protein with kelch motifs [Bienertia sinuspersici]